MLTGKTFLANKYSIMKAIERGELSDEGRNELIKLKEHYLKLDKKYNALSKWNRQIAIKTKMLQIEVLRALKEVGI